jgi:hypothetical protein
MALVAVASAKGSPGATTAVLAMGALWPRPVVVAECDTAGSDIAVRLAAADGGVLDPDRGLVTLAAAGRRGLRSDLVLSSTQQALGGLDVLLGVRTPEQAAGMGGLWPQLGPVLDGLEGYDVLADLGRLGAQTPQNAILASARLLIMVCRAEPGSVVHLRERIHVLARDLDPAGPHGVRIGVLVVADARRRRDAVRETFQALEHLETPVAHTWHLAWDSAGAAVFSGAVRSRPDRTLLVRSAMEVTAGVAHAVSPFFADRSARDAEPDPGAHDPDGIEPKPWQDSAVTAHAH